MPRMRVIQNKQQLQETVIVKKHVIDRVLERRHEMKGKDPFQIKKIVINEIQNSKLIAIVGKEEHRSYHGRIYVCKREGNTLIAVTYLLSKDERKRQEYRKAN